MSLITSFAFFLFKPFITQPKLAPLVKPAYISPSPITSSGLSLVLIPESLYITVININVTRPLNNNTKKQLNLLFFLFNAKKTY
jgi:hypothetical protein